MKWGVGLYTAQVPPGSAGSVHDEFGFLLEQARLLEQLGVDSLWLSEHHGAQDGYLPSLLPVAAAILSVTTRLRVGTGVLLAPFNHPIRLAEDVAVLDQLSGGRFILGLGTGWRHREFASFGLDPRRRLATLDETVSILRRAWQGERFDHDGTVYSFQDVLVRPRPYTPGGPAIWLGGSGPRALALAGRVADGHFGVGAPFESAVAAWRSAADVSNRQPDSPFSFGQMRSGFIAEDAETAFRQAGRGMTYTLGVHAGWAAEQAGGTEADGVATEQEVRAHNLFGDAAHITAELAPYARAFAGRDDCHLSFRLYHPYTERDKTLAALDAYGTRVVPQLRRLEGGADASQS